MQKQEKLNTREQIGNITLCAAPFVNFTNKEHLVAVKRMRPLMKVGSIWSINGRVDFHAGKS